VFEAGLDVLRSWDLVIREARTVRWSPGALAADPAARAADCNAAFADPEVRAVFASIGGDDSIRLLPYLDRAVIAAHPKILMGYSDTTVLLSAVRRAGIVAFHGPAVMAGVAQLPALEPSAAAHVRDMLFGLAQSAELPSLAHVSHGYPDWRDPSLAGRVNAPAPAGPWRVLQGAPDSVVSGELAGGCLEVLDWLRGTWAWPDPEDWDGRLLLIETSEENPSALQVTRMLRVLGTIGVFDRVSAMLLGRWRDRSPDEAREVEAAITDLVGGEFGRPQLPVVANLPFGHTDPQWVLPLGVRATVDVARAVLRLDEPWLA